MKLFSTLASVIALLTLVTASYAAGPTTNRDEFKGDKLLSKSQQDEYQRLLDEGVKYFENGQYEQAEKDFKAILAFAPKKNLAYYNLGLVKYKQGDYKTAIENFDIVIKKKSYYTGAAFYYKAISQLNLEQPDAAVKTAKRYTQERFYYEPSQNLIKSINAGSDVYYNNAVAAAADQNYELCLAEMDESVFTDTAKGKELVNKCKTAMNAPEEAAAATEVAAAPSKNYNLYFDGRIGQSDNVFNESANTVRKTIYNYTLGAEYIFKNKIDYGLGVFYDYSNAVNLVSFKDETYGAYIPLVYRTGKHRYGAEAFYNQNKYQGGDSYSESGGSVNYFYNEDKYSLGIAGSASTKVSLNSSFDYKNGTYTSVKLIANRFIDDLTLNLYVSVDQALSGDQPVGTLFIPYAYKAQRVGASAAYYVTSNSKLTLRGSWAHRDYIKVISVNGTDRDDKFSSASLTYTYTANKYTKVYVQQLYNKNTSNFDDNEVLNKNYTENVTALGLSLSY